MRAHQGRGNCEVSSLSLTSNEARTAKCGIWEVHLKRWATLMLIWWVNVAPQLTPAMDAEGRLGEGSLGSVTNGPSVVLSVEFYSPFKRDVTHTTSGFRELRLTLRMKVLSHCLSKLLQSRDLKPCTGFSWAVVSWCRSRVHRKRKLASVQPT